MSLTNWARLVLLIIAALIFQVAVVDQVVVLGDHADLMVVLAAAAGLVGGPQRGAAAGFLLGLAADLLVITPYGLSALTFVLVGFVCGLLRSTAAAREGGTLRYLACVVAGAAGTLAYALLGALIGQPGMLGHQGVDAVLVVFLGGVVLAWPALRAAAWTFRGTRATLEGYSVPSGGSAA